MDELGEGLESSAVLCYQGIYCITMVKQVSLLVGIWTLEPECIESTIFKNNILHVSRIKFIVNVPTGKCI